MKTFDSAMLRLIEHSGAAAKKFLFAGIAICALAAVPAKAADVTKAPGFMPVTWTGLYAGINGGAGMANSEFLDPDCLSCTDTKFQTAFGTFGGQLGYNWQYRAMVVGLEGDVNWAGAKASKLFALKNLFVGTANFKFDTFTSIRARMGLTLDNALVYVSAGPVWGHFRSSTNLTETDGTQLAATDNAWHPGLAIGAGVEYMLTNNWGFRGEYLFLNFKDVEVPWVGVNNCAIIETCRMNYTYSAQIARIGLNYKFGY